MYKFLINFKAKYEKQNFFHIFSFLDIFWKQKNVMF